MKKSNLAKEIKTWRLNLFTRLSSYLGWINKTVSYLNSYKYQHSEYLQCDPNRARRTTASMENTQDLLIAPKGTTLNLETKQLGTWCRNWTRTVQTEKWKRQDLKAVQKKIYITLLFYDSLYCKGCKHGKWVISKYPKNA